MKKMKKLLAVLLTLAMVMGMSLTSFAAEGDKLPEATITVNNAGKDAKFNCVQIVKPDLDAVTGWEIVDEYESYFTAEGAFVGLTEQQIIAGMIYSVNSSADKGQEIQGFSSKYAVALAEIQGDLEEGNLTSPITVTDAGVYLIKGTNDDNFTYSPMAAYVAFGPYDTKTGVPTDLVDTSVEAKRVPHKVEKEAQIEGWDEITEISRPETYKITSTVPFIPLTDTNRTYWAKDSIVGADYAVVDGKLAVTVKIGNSVNEVLQATVTVTDAATHAAKFELDLTKYVATNAYANMAIELSYGVVVKDVEVHNTITMGNTESDTKFGSDSESLYTGNITLTKYASDTNNNDLTDNAKLEGAGFKVYKKVTKEGKEVIKWAKFDANNKFQAWVDSESAATEVVTVAGGTLVVKGLDAGMYWFKEVTAPKGYSVNTADVYTELVLTGEAKEATAQLAAVTHMIDTQLSALPSTGGIGTTIFTIGGCAIMVAAAYMFFANRRKEEQ